MSSFSISFHFVVERSCSGCTKHSCGQLTCMAAPKLEMWNLNSYLCIVYVKKCLHVVHISYHMLS